MLSVTGSDCVPILTHNLLVAGAGIEPTWRKLMRLRCNHQLPASFILVLLNGFDPSFSGWKPDVLATRRQQCLCYMVPSVWLEQTTCRLQGGCSTRWAKTAIMERQWRIELQYSAWKAVSLPLTYKRSNIFDQPKFLKTIPIYMGCSAITAKKTRNPFGFRVLI